MARSTSSNPLTPPPSNLLSIHFWQENVQSVTSIKLPESKIMNSWKIGTVTKNGKGNLMLLCNAKLANRFAQVFRKAVNLLNLNFKRVHRARKTNPMYTAGGKIQTGEEGKAVQS